MKVNAPCVSTTANGGDWLRQEHSIYVCKHFTITLTEKKNEEIPFQREVATPLQSISKNVLTCEGQRGVTCKSVVNCHDLHSELKIETGKLGCD